jgi:hypothetical protein
LAIGAKFPLQQPADRLLKNAGPPPIIFLAMERMPWIKEGQMTTRRFPKPRNIVVLMVAFALAGGPLLSARQDKTADSVKSRIEEKFKQQGLLLGNDIQVTIENKTVTLSGTVRTLAMKEQAGRDAQSIAKGYKIANDLALVNPDLSPEQIAEGIMTAIEASSSYFIFDLVGLEVSAAGVATLKGWTTYPWSVTEFVKLAQAQPGVQKVENEIQRIMIMDRDLALRTQVAQLIYIRPRGPSFSRMNGPVHIFVTNNVITLSGTVDKESDIESFEGLVRSNTRAFNVINKLRVRKK